MISPDFIKQELTQAMHDNVPVIIILDNGTKVVGKVEAMCSPKIWPPGVVVLFQRSTKKIVDMDSICAMDVTLS
jgi:hypothetical protein